MMKKRLLNCVRAQNGPPKIWLVEKDAGYDPPDIFTIILSALGSVSTGDRIWWVWRETDVDENFNLSMVLNLLTLQMMSSPLLTTTLCSFFHP